MWRESWIYLMSNFYQHGLERLMLWLSGAGMSKALNVDKEDTLSQQCKDLVLRIEMWSQLQQVAPALMQDIKQHIKVSKVVTGHDGRGPCKHWGYIHFECEKDREDAADYLKDLVRKKILALPIIKSDRGPLNECWRCGAVDSVQQSLGNKSSDVTCPLHPKRRTTPMSIGLSNTRILSNSTGSVTINQPDRKEKENKTGQKGQ